MAIAMNVKLWVAISAAFFANPEDTDFMLATSAIIMFLFGTLSKKMKPCLVKKINPLEMGGYYCAGWMMVCGIIAKHSSGLLGFILMFVGILIILVVCLSLWYILRELGKNVTRKKMLKKINENGEEVEIEIDWDTDDELEEEESKRKRQKEESLEMRIYKTTLAFKEKKESKKEWPNEEKIPY